MSKVLVTESYLTDIGKAIRSKNGSTTTYKPKEMAPAISFLTPQYVLNTLIEGTITSIDIPTGVTSIRSNAFNGCSSLAKVTIPSTVTAINNEAFSGTNVSEIDVDGDYNSISGNPWGSSSTTSIVWLKGTKYPITITQSDNETITVTADGKMYTSSFEYWKGATLTASAKAASGYKAGDLSATSVTISGPVTFTIGAATVLSAIKFTVNKDNDMGPVNIEIDGTTYTIEGYKNHANGDYELFDMYESDNFYMFVKYDSNITSSMFISGGVFYKFFNSHKLTVTREKDGYGLSWSSPDYGDYAVYGVASWDCASASAASTTSDSISTIWRNLKTSFQNGENIIVEFTANS